MPQVFDCSVMVSPSRDQARRLGQPQRRPLFNQRDELLRIDPLRAVDDSKVATLETFYKKLRC